MDEIMRLFIRQRAENWAKAYKIAYQIKYGVPFEDFTNKSTSEVKKHCDLAEELLKPKNN